MLISRRVENPSFPVRGNRAGRSTGFYGHLPKFWSCKDENWDDDAGWMITSRSLDPGPSERPQWHIDLVEEQKLIHANCKYRHVSDVGYLCYVGKKYRYTFFYMGNPYRHKIFERHERRIVIDGKVYNN